MILLTPLAVIAGVAQDRELLLSGSIIPLNEDLEVCVLTCSWDKTEEKVCKLEDTSGCKKI